MHTHVTTVSPREFAGAQNGTPGIAPATRRSLKKMQLVLLLAGVTAVAGCGGNGAKSLVTPDFSFQVTPTPVSVAQGGQAQSLIVVAVPANGFNGPVGVKVGALPAGVTVSPMAFSVVPGAPAEIKVTASGSAAPGTAMLALTGAAGAVTHTVSTAITVNAASAPDFNMAISPGSLTLVAGAPFKSVAIDVSALNGFTSAVKIAVGPLPSGVTATPSSFTLSNGQLTQVHITASSAAALGAGTLMFTGTTGTLVHSVSAPITVTAAPAPSFSVVGNPSQISLVQGDGTQSFAIAATGVNGFTGTIAVSVGTLPTGTTAAPMSFTMKAGTVSQIVLTAATGGQTGMFPMFVTATSGAESHTIATSLTISKPTAGGPGSGTNASVSNSTFDFGNNLVGNKLTQQVAVVTNTGTVALTLAPALTGNSGFAIVGAQSCGTTLAVGASCDEVLSYDPSVSSTPNAQSATLDLHFVGVPAGTPHTVAISGTSAVLPAGTIAATDNPQVALYTMTLPFPGSIVVNQGLTTSYGRSTWSQSTDASGGKVSILVAGMLAKTLYHMQADVTFTNGLTAKDVDHTFTTGAIPALMVLNQTTTTTPGMTPSPGLELLNPLAGRVSGVIITDLAGNTLWQYTDPGNQNLNLLDGVKMLPDGNILMTIGPNSAVPLAGPISASAIDEMREVNLAGDTVREINIVDLNSDLQLAGCAECNVVIDTLHHDVEPLPNGHWLLLGNTTMALSPTSTPPLTNTAATTVLGDVIIDLDENQKPVWVWNEFNHLDPNRHPYMFPDWTHSNAVVYSPDDGNILVSIRHQNWVVKVNYANGAGNGSILWHLGYQGDFTLAGGTSPQDWQFAQHGPNFASPNTSGVFSLTLMDNGDDRIFGTGITCGTTGNPPCLYTTIPVFQIDESAKTATLTFQQKLPANLYSFFGGFTDQLANGNIEYDLCGLGAGTGVGSQVFEVTPDNANPQTVWTMQVTGTNLYRANRIPSFYPGVQW
jgi:arylsulfate sulfotransferase